MKCLENLSLVDDECLDDLKKDIESLINSYIDIRESCLEIFDDVKDNLNKYDVINITNTFDPEWFFQGPIPVNQVYDWEKVLKSMFEYNEESWDAFARELAHLWGPDNNLSQIDFDKNNYWFYKDGGNWDAWMVEHDYFIKEVRKAIEYQEEEQLPDLFRILKKIQSKYNRCKK